MLLRGRNIKKESGILMALSSLPSPYYIGSLGEKAYEFIDFLRKTNQTYWQILPLCPLGEGNSPYKSYSSFAGEILYIDLRFLARDGYLKIADLPEASESKKTNYELAAKIKMPLLKKAAENFNTKNSEYIKFLKENDYWLNDYSTFMAIKEIYNNESFLHFPESLKYRMPMSIEEFREEQGEKIEFYKITQFFFFSQYFELKNYAGRCGIQIIGDIPFYVSFDSADVWENPQIFKLGRDLTPIQIAGVPPDIFSKSGQLWGNPIYDFAVQKKTNYVWWRKRLIHALSMYDILRIDHFRAFADFYTVPYGSIDAKCGAWEKGPGMRFWKSMEKYIGKERIIAEDLGGETIEVKRLVDESGFPNMKVLQFAFSSDLNNKFLPRHYKTNCVCYTGTHDNDTSLGWYHNATKKERAIFNSIVPNQFEEISLRLARYACASPAKMVIIPIQDYLCEGSEYRMNTPGTKTGNWEYRLNFSKLTDELCETVKAVCKGRNK